MDEIFGCTDADGFRNDGLVDCCSEEELYKALTGLKEKWIEREQKDFPLAVIGEGGTFYDWFVRYKAADFCKGTLRSLREEAGLGSPPSANPSEAINSVIKHKTDYKKQQLPAFIESMKSLVGQQQTEVEKAIVGGGKYSIGALYKSHAYEVLDGKWWRPMTEIQRKAHIKKFNCQKLKHELPCSAVDVVGKSLPSVHVLSVSCEDAIKYTRLSQSVVSGIWEKAFQIVNPFLMSLVDHGKISLFYHVVAVCHIWLNVMRIYIDVESVVSILNQLEFFSCSCSSGNKSGALFIFELVCKNKGKQTNKSVSAGKT